MNRQELEIRKAFEHAIENQMMQRHRGIERIADHIVEIVARQALRFGIAGRMNDDQHAERFGTPPEWVEGRIGKFSAPDICQKLDAAKAQLSGAAFQLFDGGFD
jgi:phosphate uptake regulator